MFAVRRSEYCSEANRSVVLLSRANRGSVRPSQQRRQKLEPVLKAFVATLVRAWTSHGNRSYARQSVDSHGNHGLATVATHFVIKGSYTWVMQKVSANC